MARHPNAARRTPAGAACQAENSASMLVRIGRRARRPARRTAQANRAPPACAGRRPKATAAAGAASPRRSRNTSTRGLPSAAAARNALAPRLTQRREHALDVLAGAEPVDAMIDAAAGIGEAVEAADLHLVEAAAAGLRAEGAEQRMLRLQRLDGDDLGAPRQRRSAISSSSLVRQPCGGGRSSTARALRAARALLAASERAGSCLLRESARLAIAGR